MCPSFIEEFVIQPFDFSQFELDKPYNSANLKELFMELQYEEDDTDGNLDFSSQYSHNLNTLKKTAMVLDTEYNYWGDHIRSILRFIREEFNQDWLKSEEIIKKTRRYLENMGEKLEYQPHKKTFERMEYCMKEVEHSRKMLSNSLQEIDKVYLLQSFSIYKKINSIIDREIDSINEKEISKSFTSIEIAKSRFTQIINLIIKKIDDRIQHGFNPCEIKESINQLKQIKIYYDDFIDRVNNFKECSISINPEIEKLENLYKKELQESIERQRQFKERLRLEAERESLEKRRVQRIKNSVNTAFLEYCKRIFFTSEGNTLKEQFFANLLEINPSLYNESREFF